MQHINKLATTVSDECESSTIMSCTNGGGPKESLIPEWVCLGESVQIRPYNTTGVIAYIGPAEFAPGTWVGIDLDAPTGRFIHFYFAA